MKRKNLFGGGISFLIVAVLAVMAFIRGPEQIWYLAGVFAIWGIYMIAAVLLSNKNRIHASIEQRRLKKQYDRENRRAATFQTNGFHVPEVDDAPVGTVLLRHVNHRISAYLKSAYPNITWEWLSEDPEQLVAKGGTGRIRLFGIPDFNFAEVVFDQRAGINCDMMRIVPLTELDKAPGVSEKPRPDQPVDLEVWYSIQGKEVLETCVADLNSRGHASLIIKENGEICVRQADNETVQNKLKNLPGKNLWNGLVKVLEKDGLSASVADNGIKVSW